MRKKLAKIGIVAVLAAGLSVIAAGAYRNADVKLTQKKAEEIALKHSKASSKAVVGYTKLDRENGKTVYEVKIYDGNHEYEYDIDANTGEIISYSDEIEENMMYGNATGNPNSNNVAVSVEKASSTALSRVKGAKKSDIVKIKLDYDDGRPEYEGKIIYNNMEYDFEIDANTGEITSWEEERAGY